MTNVYMFFFHYQVSDSRLCCLIGSVSTSFSWTKYCLISLLTQHKSHGQSFYYHLHVPSIPCTSLLHPLHWAQNKVTCSSPLVQACTQVAECGWRKQTTSGSHFKLLVRTLWGALRAAEESSSAPSLLTSSPPFSTFTLSWWHFSLFYWEDWSNQENFCNVPALSLTTPCVCIHGLPLFLMLYAGGLCLLPGASPLLPVQGCCSGGSLSCIITFPSFYLIILISIQTCCYSSHPKSKK